MHWVWGVDATVSRIPCLVHTPDPLGGEDLIPFRVRVVLFSGRWDSGWETFVLYHRCISLNGSSDSDTLLHTFQVGTGERRHR